jgi:iron complex transport system ATP-binding protein
VQAVLGLRAVSWRVDGRTVLHEIDWEVRAGERWVLLGPNGSGKTTLMRVAALALHPSSGSVDVLGERLGHVDVRQHRRRIGVASAAIARSLRPDISVRDVAMTARHGALEPWWHTYDDADRSQAMHCLERFGVAPLADRPFGTLSAGEVQRTLLARAAMNDPELLLLDEPTAGLDLGGRERLVADLAVLASDPDAPPIVLVTHHLEEVPESFTHALLLRAGRVHASGPIDDVLVDRQVSECFGVDVVVRRDSGRFGARAG